MKLFRRLVLAWMLAWLPLSGSIAAGMPISAMAEARAMSAMTESAGKSTVMKIVPAAVLMPPCHGAAASADFANPTGSNTSCSHCVLCHLASALTPSWIPGMQAPEPAQRFSSAVPVSHPSFIPEPASPPPRPDVT